MLTALDEILNIVDYKRKLLGIPFGSRVTGGQVWVASQYVTPHRIFVAPVSFHYPSVFIDNTVQFMAGNYIFSQLCYLIIHITSTDFYYCGTFLWTKLVVANNLKHVESSDDKTFTTACCRKCVEVVCSGFPVQFDTQKFSPNYCIGIQFCRYDEPE